MRLEGLVRYWPLLGGGLERAGANRSCGTTGLTARLVRALTSLGTADGAALCPLATHSLKSGERILRV
jgi:hypothetical protein